MKTRIGTPHDDILKAIFSWSCRKYALYDCAEEICKIFLENGESGMAMRG
jgi:hypothetical protein